MKSTVSILLGGLASIALIPLAEADSIEVSSAQKDETGITLQMQPGVMQLQVCGDRTIHVLYSPDGNLPKAPSGFAVQEQPRRGTFSMAETADTVTLKASQCSVVVDKKTGALSFLDAAGKPFLSEASQGGKSVTPAIV